MSTLRLNPRGNSHVLLPWKTQLRKINISIDKQFAFLLSFAGHIRLIAKYILVQLIISPRVLAAH